MPNPRLFIKVTHDQKGADGRSQESSQLTFLSPSQYPSLFCRDYNLQACDGNRTWEANWATLANRTSREVQGTLRSNLASENRLSNMLGFQGTMAAHYTRALQTCHLLLPKSNLSQENNAGQQEKTTLESHRHGEK